MTVPNKVELFQSFCRKYVNRKVREFFRDRDDEIESNFNDLFDKTNINHVIKGLCLHEDNDTIQQTIFAFNFFYRYVNPSSALDLDDIIYGIPKADYEERVQHKPQLFFYFTQDYQERDRDRNNGAVSPVRMEVSLRVMNPEKYQLALDPDDNTALEQLAKDIKKNFQGYKYEKGIYRASYYDPSNGLRLILPYRQESDCKELIAKLLNSLDITPSYERFFKPDGREDGNLGQFEESTGKVKAQYIDKELILGERKNKVKNRAVGTVFLYKAYLQVHQREPVMLCHYKKGRGVTDL